MGERGVNPIHGGEGFGTVHIRNPSASCSATLLPRSLLFSSPVGWCERWIPTKEDNAAQATDRDIETRWSINPQKNSFGV